MIIMLIPIGVLAALVLILYAALAKQHDRITELEKEIQRITKEMK